MFGLLHIVIYLDSKLKGTLQCSIKHFCWQLVHIFHNVRRVTFPSPLSSLTSSAC